MPDLDQVVILGILFFVVTSTGILALSTVSSSNNLATTTTAVTNDPVLLDGTGQYTRIDDGEGRDETVYNSLGMAVNLSGANDSFVESSSDFEVANDSTWSVAVWARVDPEAATDTMTVVSIDGRVVVTYNGSAGNWSAWYYDDGSRNSYMLNATAPNQPGNYTHVLVHSNGTHLSLYRNNSLGERANLSADNIASAPVNSTTWNGRLEELRTFDDALNSTQRQQLVDQPLDPLVASNRTARVMFDESDASQQLIFFARPHLDQSNVTFSNGFAGSVLSDPGDYEWDTIGPRIYVTAGGELDGAPVAYVSYTNEGFGRTLEIYTSRLTRAINLSTILPVLLLLIVVISYLLILRGR